MNHRAKFDAFSVILGGEIHNRTNTQTNEQTNSKRYIYTMPNGASLARRLRRCIPPYGNVYMRVGIACALGDLSDFGLLGEQNLQKCEIPCLGRR